MAERGVLTFRHASNATHVFILDEGSCVSPNCVNQKIPQQVNLNQDLQVRVLRKLKERWGTGVEGQGEGKGDWVSESVHCPWACNVAARPGMNPTPAVLSCVRVTCVLRRRC